MIIFKDTPPVNAQTNTLRDPFLTLIGDEWCEWKKGLGNFKPEIKQWCKVNLKRRVYLDTHVTTSERIHYEGRDGFFRYRFPVVCFLDGNDMTIFRLVYGNYTTTEVFASVDEVRKSNIMTVYEDFVPIPRIQVA